tara:strand:+ start:9285 stop:9920 length:636 start_codon:yes stop_codon:yes gene_type:complete
MKETKVTVKQSVVTDEDLAKIKLSTEASNNHNTESGSTATNSSTSEQTVETNQDCIEQEQSLDVNPATVKDKVEVKQKAITRSKNGTIHKDTKSKSGKKIGRPRNTALETVKTDASVIKEYKKRMLTSPKSVKVLEAILTAASDPDHKNFNAASKLVIDRILPISEFEASKAGNSNSSISITITGVDGSKTVVGTDSKEEAEEADYEEVED